ncbi:MAG: DNA methyltransferase [Segetibacter sp.]
MAEKSGQKMVSREHFFFRHQPGDSFITKIASLVVDISEFDKEGNIAIAEVASRIKSALDIERVVKRFYREYQDYHFEFLKLIDGIDNEADRRWYASVILNRLMFIYFLQKKFFLDNGDEKYLNKKLEFSKINLGKNKFYEVFLDKLFFEGFAKPKDKRGSNEKERREINLLIGEIRYLNGGLFLHHKIEIKYKGKIKIPDAAFDNLFGLFNRYSWTLNDTPGGADNEMNPDVLGYIFEKYINQKAFGAYYTRTEITEYLCEQTVYKLILDEVNGTELPDSIPDKLREKLSTKRYDSIAELLLNLDAANCRKLVVGENAVLPNLSLLDPACGSGAFLVAAMKTLINVYAAILGKIEFLGDKKLNEWKDKIEQDHPSINYYIKKQIITHNLYGVDLMEEATEIAKLRLFLALVASAETVEQLEPLPNIDFNIMSGNSLIGLMRVNENEYNKHQHGDMFKKSYRELVQNKEAAIRAFKSLENTDENMEIKKESIDRIEAEANATLNLMLAQEFSSLGIKYEQVTWDERKNKEGKSFKRNITIKDIEALEPFHWGYEFSEIFRKKDGFDAIITNPPWEVFQTNEKEFFQQYDREIKKKKLRIEDWEQNKEDLMADKEIRQAWLQYSSQYPHQWAYFKKAPQYKNQISVVNGKAVGNKPNLYCLFTEQGKNLMRNGGYCGIVIPSGIYTDLGTKQLREMLFDETAITGIFCFENRKTIFENVDSRFKFVVLSFEKGKNTKSFPAAFMRHNVFELETFPRYGAVPISVALVKKLSPNSYSIIEFKNEQEVSIAEKISQYPLLYGDSRGWNVEFYGEEMNMTRSSSIFKTKPDKIILYEGGMFHQFNHRFSEPRYWLDERIFGEEFLNKRAKRIDGLDETPKDLKNDYEAYRLAIRKIARNTDTRTLIATILPKHAIAGNSITVNFPFKHHKNRYNDLNYGNDELLLLTAILNSYVADFTLRSRVSANLNLFYLQQLSVPRLTRKDKWYKSIVERVARLICTTEEFAELWEEVMNNKWSEKKAATQEYERNKIRAELDGMIAHIYGLTEEEFTYILSTFPIVPQPQKVAAQNAYRDVERGLIK